MAIRVSVNEDDGMIDRQAVDLHAMMKQRPDLQADLETIRSEQRRFCRRSQD